MPKLLRNYEFIEAEKMIFSPELKLSGTVDLIMRNKRTKNICVFDWKTNKKIDKENNWGDFGKEFLYHLDHCNYNHYSLQLNIYRKLLYREGYGDEFENAEMGLFHITEEQVNGIRVYPMNKEVDLIFKVLQPTFKV